MLLRRKYFLLYPLSEMIRGSQESCFIWLPEAGVGKEVMAEWPVVGVDGWRLISSGNIQGL